MLIAAIGPRPMVAAAASGSPVALPEVPGRRDGSGIALEQPVAMLAGREATVDLAPPGIEE